MAEQKEISPIKVIEELHICPSCGYDLGFHTSFLNVNSSKDNPIKSTKEVFRVILICPECRARYDVGWRVSFVEPESRFVKTTIISPVNP
ncbi:hypothetical protein [uncultured Methanoregula sp.]|uniref:hypothetical protein n=1 Tax=uncultured Methanoregula sp. TaxID=1005933 RepID=UPI002AAAA922|nr:hypothetical protein [uncultured Methanoregula sp.]